MLGAGSNTGGLNAADISGSHLARKVGIFGEILEVTTAEGTAFDIQTGSQQHVHIIRGSFPAQILSQFLTKRHVPAVCHGSGSGETGGGDGSVQTRIVNGTGVFAQTVRAVRQKNGGKTQSWKIPGGPHGFALQQGSLFFQSHPGNQFFDVHSNLLYI